MKKIFILILIVTSCNKDKWHSSQFYGQYITDNTAIGYIYFTHPNNYVIETYDESASYYDVIAMKTVESGTYKIHGDTIIMNSGKQDRSFLRIINSEMLEVMKHPGFIEHDTLYCGERIDKKGKILFGGIWEDGKKDGIWVYYHKNYQENILYKEGKILKRDTCPN
jgi:hypothetical protein